MKLEQVAKAEDILECIDAYSELNDYSFLNVDKIFVYKNLLLAAKRKKYFKIIKENDKIVAWLFADSGNSLHINEKILQQYYYYSAYSGTKAFKAIKVFHEDLLDYAKQNKYSVVFSPGSHLDEKYVFTRMLEKLGWNRRGYLAYKRPN